MQYVFAVAVAIEILLMLLVTPFLVIHGRTRHDHGAGCWWCHPRLRRR
ncbi:hypothetical protein [Streptomyces sp. NPDC093109]